MRTVWKMVSILLLVAAVGLNAEGEKDSSTVPPSKVALELGTYWDSNERDTVWYEVIADFNKATVVASVNIQFLSYLWMAGSAYDRLDSPEKDEGTGSRGANEGSKAEQRCQQNATNGAGFSEQSSANV